MANGPISRLIQIAMTLKSFVGDQYVEGRNHR